jgi:hypothetical protein
MRLQIRETDRSSAIPPPEPMLPTPREQPLLLRTALLTRRTGPTAQQIVRKR